VVVKTFPTYSSNPDGTNFPLYCKYQLLKYKSWTTEPQNAWDNETESNDLYIGKWFEFLNTKIGRKTIPQWEKEILNIEKYDLNSNEDLTDLPEKETDRELKEEWMFMSELSKNIQINNAETKIAADFEFLEKGKNLYTSEQTSSMPFWLERFKTNYFLTNEIDSECFDTSTLNTRQKLVYDLIKTHSINEIESPLRMIVTGQGGTGKSFLIQALKALLGNTCVVCSFFGIAAYNVKGQTLHSLFQLPIAGRRQGDLKGNSLQRLQNSLKKVSYIITDEYSVIGEKMFGYIDKRCRQATGVYNEFFGGLSLILVGDIAQLPPVKDFTINSQQTI